MSLSHAGMISGIFAIRLPENSQKKNLRHENYMQRYKISTLMIIDKLIIWNQSDFVQMIDDHSLFCYTHFCQTRLFGLI